MNFKELHNQERPLLLGNVWDVPSSKMAEKLGFQAIGTSSSAIAALLGYEDGEQMEFSELRYFVERIKVNSNLPLSVDLEAGYSRNPIIITEHIRKMADLGVSGINIEDSIVDDKRILLPAKEFANKLERIMNVVSKENLDIFINVRTDTFLLEHPNVLEETKKRIQLYVKAGADGIFIPCIKKEIEIKEIVRYTQLPVNVMCVPDLSDFDTLKKLGVRRISIGNFLFDKMYSQLGSTTKRILDQGSFQSIF
ncbi:isocitrate lyase/phosphoenolpyruvate mutase family protein [uncultured Aquimarina sp.]|uniref:isocitrate lyase/PEP mutase family protein n=1 Tax=uncultured Aquimarina sp. TaxID=575652 RepID=UPI0026170E65|nr:isocitrate lyase/phosphoenolpyruvate mutase family protein [uncultured Aquimarina sp.]